MSAQQSRARRAWNWIKRAGRWKWLVAIVGLFAGVAAAIRGRSKMIDLGREKERAATTAAHRDVLARAIRRDITNDRRIDNLRTRKAERDARAAEEHARIEANFHAAAKRYAEAETADLPKIVEEAEAINDAHEADLRKRGLIK